METTPKELTALIRDFCKTICEGAPNYIQVHPETAVDARNCHELVSLKVQSAGGNQIFGWTIWEHEHFLLGEFHSIWQTPESKLVDITHRPEQPKAILFLRDPVRVFKGERYKNYSLAKTKEGKAWIRNYESRFAMEEAITKFSRVNK